MCYNEASQTNSGKRFSNPLNSNCICQMLSLISYLESLKGFEEKVERKKDGEKEFLRNKVKKRFAEEEYGISDELSLIVSASFYTLSSSTS